MFGLKIFPKPNIENDLDKLRPGLCARFLRTASFKGSRILANFGISKTGNCGHKSGISQ